MAHHCEAALVTCVDFRLHQRPDGRNCIAEFLRRLGLDCDVISRAGGIQDLVRPHGGSDQALVRDLEVSVDLHEAGRLLLVNHADCGAYAWMGGSPDEERAQHIEDLRAARALLSRRFPRVQISLFFAELVPGTADEFAVQPMQ
ncbi:hypothetical protein JXA88_12570 [Candidatus Fermentibacteria bacterium]|nr:hypothetical protein [Candidatus Fermentibacteria bacterium]